ncbi:MAG: radical SAM protein [Anaerolineales bacterium]|nr:radical SAM protein [Anaerolineales bacterium]
MFAYLQNLFRLRRGDFTLSPRLAVYYVTMQCNLNCTYCEDFGARRNHLVTPAPPFEDAKRILDVIRTGVDRLWLTGGEPLMHPQILDLLVYARHDLKFREISLITNGTLLADVVARNLALSEASANERRRSVGDEATSSSNRGLLRRRRAQHVVPLQNMAAPRNDILSLLDRLIISLDSLDPQALDLVSLPQTHTETVLANVRAAASLQKTHKFKLILNAVITPETLPGMDKLLAFCAENKVQISFSPQSVNNLPRYELVTSPEYRLFLEKLIRLKKQGAPIFGSLSYFRILLDQTPYECYPTLIPRILPDGWLAYPCKPMEKAGGEQGGQAVNLLNVQTWDEAWKIATKMYGEVPTSCVSCFQQCYAEPSLMQARPVEYVLERLRGNDVSAYAPG